MAGQAIEHHLTLLTATTVPLRVRGTLTYMVDSSEEMFYVLILALSGLMFFSPAFSFFIPFLFLSLFSPFSYPSSFSLVFP